MRASFLLLLLQLAALCVHGYFGIDPPSEDPPDPMIIEDPEHRIDFERLMKTLPKKLSEESSSEEDAEGSEDVVEEAEVGCEEGNFFDGMSMECTECSPCVAGEYVVSGCKGKQDTVCGSCSVPDENSDSFWYSCEHSFNGKLIRLNNWRGENEKLRKEGKEVDQDEELFFAKFETYLKKVIMNGVSWPVRWQVYTFELTADDVSFFDRPEDYNQLAKHKTADFSKVFTITRDDVRVSLDDPKWKDARVEDYSVFHDSGSLDEYSDDPFETESRIFLERKVPIDGEPIDPFLKDEEIFSERDMDDDDVDDKNIDSHFPESEEKLPPLPEEWESTYKKDDAKLQPLDLIVDEEDERRLEEDRLIEEMLRIRANRKIVVIGIGRKEKKSYEDRTTTETAETTEATAQPCAATRISLKHAAIICVIALCMAFLYQLILMPIIQRRQLASAAFVPPMSPAHQIIIHGAYKRLEDEEKLCPVDV